MVYTINNYSTRDAMIVSEKYLFKSWIQKKERELRNFIIKRRGTAVNDPRLPGVHGMTTKSLLRDLYSESGPHHCLHDLRATEKYKPQEAVWGAALLDEDSAPRGMLGVVVSRWWPCP